MRVKFILIYELEEVTNCLLEPNDIVMISSRSLSSKSSNFQKKKRKRIVWPVSNKLEAVEFFKQNNHETLNRFGCSSSNLYDWKEKEELLLTTHYINNSTFTLFL